MEALRSLASLGSALVLGSAAITKKELPNSKPQKESHVGTGFLLLRSIRPAPRLQISVELTLLSYDRVVRHSSTRRKKPLCAEAEEPG